MELNPTEKPWETVWNTCPRDRSFAGQWRGQQELKAGVWCSEDVPTGCKLQNFSAYRWLEPQDWLRSPGTRARQKCGPGLDPEPTGRQTEDRTRRLRERTQSAAPRSRDWSCGTEAWLHHLSGHTSGLCLGMGRVRTSCTFNDNLENSVYHCQIIGQKPPGTSGR